MLESIKKLRELTGAGMMEVKKALQDAAGDETRAVELLRERGIVKAAKKADREATDGLVRAFVSADGTFGALLEVNSETDFVARNEEFRNLVNDLVQQIAQNQALDGIVDPETLRNMRLASGESVDERLKAAIAKIGENLVLQRGARLSTRDGLIVSYVHANDRIGVLLELSGPKAEAEKVARDIALHIAAERPRYLVREEVNAEDLEKEREILKNKALNEGKKPEIVDKIIAGQLSKFYEDHVLLEQRFVKDNALTISQLLPSGVSIKRFARFEIGLK